MFYFLNKMACCFTLQSRALSELNKPQIKPSSMEVSTKLCGVELCFVSSKQFISITQVHRSHKLRPKLDLEFLCHVIRIRDIMYTFVA